MRAPLLGEADRALVEGLCRRLITLIFADRALARRHGRDPSGAASDLATRVWPCGLAQDAKRGFSFPCLIDQRALCFTFIIIVSVLSMPSDPIR